jgi:hypothetical protein
MTRVQALAVAIKLVKITRLSSFSAFISTFATIFKLRDSLVYGIIAFSKPICVNCEKYEYSLRHRLRHFLIGLLLMNFIDLPGVGNSK